MKRALSLFLALVFLLGMLPIGTVSAATYSGHAGSLKWTLDTSTGKLTISGNGAMPEYSDYTAAPWYDYRDQVTKLYIQSGVTSVGSNAFYGYSKLTYVSLANSVTTLGTRAFYDCDGLTSGVSAGYVTSMGSYVFADCDNIASVTLSGQTTAMGSGVFYSCNNLETVIVGSGANIGSSTFMNCSKLTTVRFSTGVKSIGSSAFSTCTKLTDVTLPEGLVRIGSEAFSHCYGLKEITIPSSVTEIGSAPFYKCDNLTAINVAEGNSNYCSDSGVLYNKDKTLLINYPIAKSTSYYTIPDTVTEIGDNALYACANIKSLTFPSGLTEIGEGACSECDGMTSISLSGSTKTIGKEAFAGCSAVKSISISTDAHIGEAAFKGCKFVTSISLSGNIQVGVEAFMNCYALTSLSLGEGVTRLENKAFYDCYELRSVLLPESLCYVGLEAFGYCLELTSVTVLNPCCVFYGMNSSENFWGYANQTIRFHGHGSSSIRNYAETYEHPFTAHSFNDEGICTVCGGELYSYDSGKWSYQATVAGGGIAYFYGYTTVPSYDYDASQPWQNFNYAITALVMGNDVKVINGSAFKNQVAMETLNLVNVEQIKPGAFSGCTSLKRLYLPDTLTELGEQAFSGCTSLLSAVLRPNVERVGYNAFYGCTTLVEVDVLNPNCYISDYKYTLGDPEITTIFGFIPSTAYNYATKHGYQFIALDGCEYGYHNYEVASTTPADCEAAGEVVYQCTGCEESYCEVLEPLGHDMAEEITPPTCTQQGYTLHFCLRCSYSYQDTYTGPIDHNYIGVTTIPTCTEGGYTEYTCHGCGDSYIADYVDPLGHNYYIHTTEPTCLEGGYTEHTCFGCGDSYITDYTDPLGHDYQAQVTMPTCLEGGYTFYVCLNCNDSYTADYTDPTGHEYIAFVTDPSCYEGGYTTYVCMLCNDNYTADYTEATGHFYEAYVQHPTCSEGGYTNYFCHSCGDSYTADYTEPTGHIYLNGYCIYCREKAPDFSGYPTDFSDVSQNAWYAGAVEYVVSRGLMNGIGIGKFEPDSPMTRAMLVTVLWRYEREPSGYVNVFTDIKDGQWYTNAVAWAAANGIVGGIGNGRFDPDGKITREQLATILFRYCNSNGIDTAARADLSSFPDDGKVSAYASDAMSWAVAVGLVTGTQNGNHTYLDPQGNATRAQVATILMRFIENVASGSGQAPSESGYREILLEMLEDDGSNAEALLYDIDGNGVLELVLIFRVSANSDDPYSMPVTAYSVYTMQDKTVIPLIENQTLYPHAGGSHGWVGVVELGGERFFAAYDAGGEVGWGYGSWEIYRISDIGMGLQTAVDFQRFTDETDAIDYAQSFVTFNGERFGYETYESWVSSVTYIAVIDGSCNNLEELLLQLP